MRYVRLTVACLFAALLGATAHAAESPPFHDARNTATLVSYSDTVAPGRPVRVALRLRLAPGWHTYWRNPGDAGVPAQLDWMLPAGGQASDIAWPVPQRQEEGPLVTFGFSGEVLLPVTVTAPAGPLPVSLHAAWLSCEKVCVPEEATLRLDLPEGDGAPSAEAALFRAADAQAPRASPWQARIARSGALDLAGADLKPGVVRAAQFFPEAPDRIAAAAAQPLTLRDGGLRLGLQPSPGADLSNPLSGVLVLQDGSGQSSAFQVTAAPGALPPSAPPLPGLGRALALALLGGLVLNLMPCVFPVLAIKAAGLARLGREGRGAARAHAGAYTLGVVLSFCAIGLALIALRAAGSLAGWGFQFARPEFVAMTAWLLFAVGLNLSGVFSLDGFGLAGAGQNFAHRRGLAGSFATGALAVLVATPCTAPFMGAALAVALASSPVVAIGVFAALGLGLAAPYALLALIPGAARLLPRPGAWMEVLRQALAFPMYAAAVWLLWVVGQEAGSDGVLATAGGAVALAFLAWLVGRAQLATSTRRAWRAAAVVATCAAVLAGAALLRGLPPAQATEQRVQDGAEPFSPARLAELRAAGRPVFIDMTAAWCVTCLVNERVALHRDAVRAAFASGHVTLLRGDWTRQHSALTAFLHEYGRDGVPLYVFYPAGDHAPVVLPQILTEGVVLDAVARPAA